MKITLSQSEVKASVDSWLLTQPHYMKSAIELWMTAQGYKVSDADTYTLNPDGTVEIDMAPHALPVAPTDKSPSTAPIGQTIDGVKITHYGYPGDSSPDSQSMKGIGDRGNKLTPNLSVALTRTAREKFFGVASPSTGNTFTLGGSTFRDEDSAPEQDPRVDVYDPFYTGIDAGCTPEMFAKSKAEMVAAGILT